MITAGSSRRCITLSPAHSFYFSCWYFNGVDLGSSLANILFLYFCLLWFTKCIQVTCVPRFVLRLFFLISFTTGNKVAGLRSCRN